MSGSSENGQKSAQATPDVDAAPALGAELEAALAGAKPVTPRRPARQLAVFTGLSLVYALALVGLLSLRRDLSALPLTWVVVFASAWLAGFVAVMHLATVPRRGEVMPRTRAAGALALVVGLVLVAAGLLWSPAAPGLSLVHGPALSEVFGYGQHCLQIGTLAALFPLGLAAFAVRGAIPTGARWAGFAIGAAGGALGGLVVHFHCSVATNLHNGLIHPAVMLLAGALGALVVPLLARTSAVRLAARR